MDFSRRRASSTWCLFAMCAFVKALIIQLLCVYFYFLNKFLTRNKVKHLIGKGGRGCPILRGRPANRVFSKKDLNQLTMSRENFFFKKDLKKYIALSKTAFFNFYFFLKIAPLDVQSSSCRQKYYLVSLFLLHHYVFSGLKTVTYTKMLRIQSFFRPRKFKKRGKE